MKRSLKDYAREKRDIAEAARPLGNFIVDQLHGRAATTLPPSVPAAAAKGPMPKRGKGVDKGAASANTREAVVLRECLRWLKNQGMLTWRNNSGTLWANGQPVSFGHPGSPDIIGMTKDGRFIGVECKSARGKQSEKQKAFEAKVRANNGIYILARSVVDLERALGAAAEGAV